MGSQASLPASPPLPLPPCEALGTPEGPPVPELGSSKHNSFQVAAFARGRWHSLGSFAVPGRTGLAPPVLLGLRAWPRGGLLRLRAWPRG